MKRACSFWIVLITVACCMGAEENEKVDNKYIKRVYPTSGIGDARHIKEWLSTYVCPEEWVGSAGVEEKSERLTVNQTPEMHEEIRAFFANLKSRGRDARTKQMDVDRKLQAKVSLALDKVPLSNALDSVVRRAGMVLELRGVDGKEPVTLALQNVSASAALDQMARMVKANWWVAGDKIVVGAGEPRKTTGIFDVKALIDREVKATKDHENSVRGRLINLVKSQLPGIKDAPMMVHDNMLVICHSQQTIARVGEILDETGVQPPKPQRRRTTGGSAAPTLAQIGDALEKRLEKQLTLTLAGPSAKSALGKLSQVGDLNISWQVPASQTLPPVTLGTKTSGCISTTLIYRPSSVDASAGKPSLDLMTGAASDRGYAFATQVQVNPNVLIDLGGSTRIDRVEIDNATGTGEEMKKLTIWLSENGQSWKQAWQADAVKEKWEASLNNASARYVRIGLQGNYALRLRHVKIFSDNGPMKVTGTAKEILDTIVKQAGLIYGEVDGRLTITAKAGAQVQVFQRRRWDLAGIDVEKMENALHIVVTSNIQPESWSVKDANGNLPAIKFSGAERGWGKLTILSVVHTEAVLDEVENFLCDLAAGKR